ncbi:MAG: nucleoside triphosphate pyrophosphohydrolase [Clostridia bacterium]|nr:nucleoside triphosphate pyrophosphohydrolase [Clostridia bacterium]
MARREYDKLVRDRIPEIIEKQGQRPVCDALTHEACLEYLAKKLGEEAAEYAESREVEELADVVEVVRGILHHRGVEWDELERIRLEKYDRRGGFEAGIRLVAVEE